MQKNKAAVLGGVLGLVLGPVACFVFAVANSDPKQGDYIVWGGTIFCIILGVFVGHYLGTNQKR